MKAFGRKKQPQSRQRPSASRSAGPQSFSYYGLQRQQTARTASQHKGKSKKQQKTSRDPVKALSGLSETFSGGSRLQQLLHTFGAVLLGAVLLLCFISVLQIDTTPRISIINDSEGFALHSEDEYAAVASDAIRGSVLNSNKITINTQAISADVAAAFPEVKSVAMALPLVGHRPTVYIELTRPILLLNTASQSVVIDNTGQALVKAQDVTNVSRFNLPSVYDQSQLKLEVGDVVLSSTAVTFIQAVQAQLAAQNLDIKRMVLPAGAEQLDIYLKGDGYFTKYNLHEANPNQQVGTFLAVRKKLTKEKALPTEYIDVRLPGRAYYK